MKCVAEEKSSAEAAKRRTARARELEKARSEELIHSMKGEMSAMTDKVMGLNTELKYWKDAASSLADTGVRTCASALTIPECNPPREHDDNSNTLNSYKLNGHVSNNHDKGPSLLLPPPPHPLSSSSSPKELLAFLHINSIKGNVLVSRKLLTTLLQRSKVNQLDIFFILIEMQMPQHICCCESVDTINSL